MHEAALHPGPYHPHQECNCLGVSRVFLDLGVVGRGEVAGGQFCLELLGIQLVLEAPAGLCVQVMLEAWKGSVLCRYKDSGQQECCEAWCMYTPHQRLCGR